MVNRIINTVNGTNSSDCYKTTMNKAELAASGDAELFRQNPVDYILPGITCKKSKDVLSGSLSENKISCGVCGDLGNIGK